LIEQEPTDKELLLHDSLPFIQVKYDYIKYFGLFTATILGYLISKYTYFEKEDKLTENGEFYRTLNDMSEDLGIGYQPIQKSLSKLTKTGYLKVTRRGVPPKNFYKIEYKKIIRDVLKSKEITSFHKDIRGNIFKDIENNMFKDIAFDTYNNNIEYIISNKMSSLKKSTSLKEEVVSAGADTSPPQKKSSLLKRRSLSQKRKMAFERARRAVGRDTSDQEQNQQEIPSEHLTLIEYWNNRGLRRVTEKAKKGRLTISNTLKRLRRNAMFKNVPDKEMREKNKRFSLDEIKQAIYNFHLAATNKHYEPKGRYKETLSSVSMQSFFYNPFSENSHKSLFLKYLTYKPELVKGKETVDELEIKDKRSYSKLLEFYRTNVLGSDELNPSSNDLKNIAIGANKLVDFLAEKRRIISNSIVHSIDDLSDLFLDTMEATVENECSGDWSKFSSGYFSSEATFSRRFPAYLNSQAVILQDSNSQNGSGSGWSIYKDLPK
jgi:hypothetical protein